jgi:hypothetical protein
LPKQITVFETQQLEGDNMRFDLTTEFWINDYIEEEIKKITAEVTLDECE